MGVGSSYLRSAKSDAGRGGGGALGWRLKSWSDGGKYSFGCLISSFKLERTKFGSLLGAKLGLSFELLMTAHQMAIPTVRVRAAAIPARW